MQLGLEGADVRVCDGFPTRLFPQPFIFRYLYLTRLPRFFLFLCITGEGRHQGRDRGAERGGGGRVPQGGRGACTSGKDGRSGACFERGKRRRGACFEGAERGSSREKKGVHDWGEGFGVPHPEGLTGEEHDCSQNSTPGSGGPYQHFHHPRRHGAPCGAQNLEKP